MIPSVQLKNGMTIPQIGFGTYKLENNAVCEPLKIALATGYTHIDTAALYENESSIGKVLAEIPREKLFITSKVQGFDLTPENILKTCEQTLQELGTDYLNLYLIHWPNDEYSLEKMLKAMEELLEQGKIKAIGVSNFSLPLLKRALEICDKIVVNQVEFHPWLYQKELLEFCTEQGIGFTAYCPLGRGKWLEKLQNIADKHGKTPGQISLRWCFEKGTIIIPKATSEQHIRENMKIFDFSLDEKDLEYLDNLEQHRVVDYPFVHLE